MKIAVVTGSRAEYGLLKWLMTEIQKDEACQLQLIVTGMHLQHEYGDTVNVIQQDGFHIDECVDIHLTSDTAKDIATSVGLGVQGAAATFAKLHPDLVVVLGDRFEILSFAQAALIMKIPIAHIHGGEVTKGAIDDAIRHAITKMSHLHFVATEAYRHRVIQMGENPQRVFTVGAPGLDAFKRCDLLTRHELEKKLSTTFGKKNALVTYHPVTIKSKKTYEGIGILLDSLNSIPGLFCIFTGANADEGGRAINAEIKKYLSQNPSKGMFCTSLGMVNYLSCLKSVDFVIGNSSSGLIEAPLACVPTINIGDRQTGRLKSASVIDVPESKNDIIAAINTACSGEFRSMLSEDCSVYGKGNASKKIFEIIKMHLAQSRDQLFLKEFFDISYEVSSIRETV